MTGRLAVKVPLIALVLTAAGWGAARAAMPLMRDPLEGKWQVDVTPDDDARQNHARDFQDTLTFKPNSFESSYLAKHGFKPVPYEENTRPGQVGGFDVIQKSSTDEGTAKWSGLVTATEMSGSLVWTKKDGTALNYSFKGSKQ